MKSLGKVLEYPFREPMPSDDQGSSGVYIPVKNHRGLGRLDQALYFYNPIINN